MQINPPFDGSAPCPLCDRNYANIGALLHNARNRLGEGKMMVKLMDLRDTCAGGVPEPTVDHPHCWRMKELAEKMMLATNGLVQDGMVIRWVPGTVEAVMRLEPFWTEVLVEREQLRHLHDDDARHWRGEENVLRSAQGSESNWWGHREGDTSYNHFVRKVDNPPAGAIRYLRHSVCGTAYEVHEHFWERIDRDPAFYGKFWCDCCRSNVPWAQIEVHGEKSDGPAAELG